MNGIGGAGNYDQIIPFTGNVGTCDRTRWSTSFCYQISGVVPLGACPE